MDTLEELLQRGQQVDTAALTASLSGSQVMLTAPETERMIESLKVVPLDEVGSSEWHRQHQWVEQLNVQAHLNAQSHSDEFVVESLVSFDRLGVLVEDLLVAEAWRTRVYPLLSASRTGGGATGAPRLDALAVYLALYHEVAVANLLEVSLFHSHACAALSEDHLLELVDWQARQLATLADWEHVPSSAPTSADLESLLRRSAEEEERERRREIEFGVAMCALTIARYITDALPSLPLGVTVRLVNSNDIPLTLAALIDKKPWERRAAPPPPPPKVDKNKAAAATAPRRTSGIERFIDGRWTEVEPKDLSRVTQADAQAWLALSNLLCDPQVRSRYDLNGGGWRRERLLQLRRHLHELLLDQLPPLKAGLLRVLDELALGVLSDSAAGRAAGLVLEQVPAVREKLLAGADWRKIAEQQAKTSFALNKEKGGAKKGGAKKERNRAGASITDAGESSSLLDELSGGDEGMRERLSGLLRAVDLMCEMEDLQKKKDQKPGQSSSSAAAAAPAGGVAPPGLGAASGSPSPGDELPLVKVKAWRKVHQSGVWEPWHDFQLRADEAKPVEHVSMQAPAGSGSDKAPGPGVRGDRYRLKMNEDAAKRPLPCQAKISVLVSNAGDRDELLAEALLQLPELNTRRGAEYEGGSGAPPEQMWATVGLLAKDGFALQLRLKKAAKPLERDRVSGVWYAYHVAGGALTLASGSAGTFADSPAATCGAPAKASASSAASNTGLTPNATNSRGAAASGPALPPLGGGATRAPSSSSTSTSTSTAGKPAATTDVPLLGAKKGSRSPLIQEVDSHDPSLSTESESCRAEPESSAPLDFSTRGPSGFTGEVRASSNRRALIVEEEEEQENVAAVVAAAEEERELSEEEAKTLAVMMLDMPE